MLIKMHSSLKYFSKGRAVRLDHLIEASPSYSEQDFNYILDAFMMPTRAMMIECLRLRFKCLVHVNFAYVIMCNRFAFYMRCDAPARNLSNKVPLTFEEFNLEATVRLEAAKYALAGEIRKYVEITKKLDRIKI